MNELEANKLLEEAKEYIGREFYIWNDDGSSTQCIFNSTRSMNFGIGNQNKVIKDLWAILKDSDTNKQYELSLKAVVDAFREYDKEN